MKAYPEAERRGRLAAGRRPRWGATGAVTIHQDADLYVHVQLEPGEAVTHELRPGRYAWVQVARGGVTLNGQALAAGDGAAVSEESARGE